MMEMQKRINRKKKRKKKWRMDCKTIEYNKCFKRGVKVKKNKGIVIVIVFIFVIVGALIFFKARSIDSINISPDIGNVSLNIENEIRSQKKEEYVDNNNMKIGLYIDEGNSKKLVKNYYCDFTAENIMGLFYAIPTDDEVVSGDDFKTVFEKYYNKYVDSKNYKIGYNIKFTLENGETIDQIVLNPDDAYLLFPEVQCYLYDDINLIPGRSYYHITQDIMNDERICSSIKLVGDKNTKDIVSPIELTVFTFDGDDDFTPITKKYRGNSSYTIFIYEE